MNFLNPLALFGLAAAVLPLVIHLMSKHQAKEVPFPSIKLLRTMQTDRIRLLRLKQVLVLLLRTLIIIVIVLAFARPALRSMFRESARTSMVIILDASASMLYVDNGEMLFKRALRKTEELFDLLRRDDAAAVVVGGDVPTVLSPGLTSDRNQVLRKLQDVENSWTTGNPDGAFDLALNLLHATGTQNREIYYLTDGAVNAFPDSLAAPDRDIRLYTVVLGPKEREGSILSTLELVDKIIAPGRKITFRVEGFSGSGGRETDVEFFVNGERKGKTIVGNQPGNRLGTTFTYTPELPGWYSIHAEVSDGYFEPGEQRRVAVNIPRTLRVLIAGETSEDTFFLERALNPVPENPVFTITALSASALTARDISDADVVCLSGVSDLSKAVYQALLNAVVKQGKGLIVFPAYDVNRLLYSGGIFRDLFPATTVSTKPNEGQDGGQVTTIDWFDFSHPVLRDISDSGAFHRPDVRSFVRLEPSPGARILARFQNSSMAAGEIDCGKGRVIVFALNARSRDSDFPVSGIFVPFIIRAVQYAAREIDMTRAYEAGELLREPLGEVPIYSPVTLKAQDGAAVLVDVERSRGGVRLKDEAAGIPGFFSVFVGGEERLRFGVNAPAEEIAFNRAGLERLQQVFLDRPWRSISDTENITEVVMNDRLGRELRGMFIVFALVLIVLEMIVSRKL